ncbi:putative ribonuclease H-like domain-containing protein [Tanacetum coccineum]
MKKMYCLVVTDDFNRFSWVFFLATKDETSEILKTFITCIENLIDLRVKVIRCDNRTEFKNKVMNQFYEMKGLKREYSVARTPQQNRVAERKNRTLLEAARTMLADSKLPTTFWTEAINTTCYVQNRVLVIKPQNKTPYELFLGRKPALSFIRPFGCLVTILNNIDHLGKFDGKADEGFFIGYSTNSKAFRVFNSRTRIVEENLHVQFSENTPNITRSKPSTKACNVADSKSSPDAGFKPSGEKEKKDAEDPGNKDSEVLSTKEPRVNQEKDDNVSNTNNVNTTRINNTNTINTVSPTVNAAGIEVNVVDPKLSIELPDDLNMPELEDIVYSDDDEDVGVEADMNNIDAFMPVSPIPTTRIHKDHPVEQIIRDLHSVPQTRRMTKNLEEHEEPKKVIHTLKDPSWIEAMRDELLQFKLQKNKSRLVIQGYTQEEGIHYDEVFAPVARIEAIRQFLAYALFKDFVVYQMDVKSAFLYGKIEKEVYVCQPPGFEDPNFSDIVYKALYGLHQAPRAWYETLSTYLLDNGFQRGKIDKTLFIRRVKGDILLVQVYVDDIIFGSTKKSLCIEFENMMHKKFQMSSMGELTFFLGLQVKQKEDGIFISQDKYVTEILKKFGFTNVKTASTPMETHKPLLKDADGEDVDEHLYRSMIGSLMYLTSSRPDIMFADSPFDLVAYTDSDYAGASFDRKSTIGGCQFLGCRLISWQCKKQTVVANSTTEAEYIAASNCCGQFWDTVKAKTVNGEVQLQALVDKKKVIITESTIRRDFQLEDANGVDCLPNAAIFEQLTLMGYEKLSQKLTFYKAFFSPQWKFLIHTILQCLSAKTTAWNEFSCTMASAIICLATNQKFNFSKYIFDNMVKNVDSMKSKKKNTEVPQPSGSLDNVPNENVPTTSNDPLLSGEDRVRLTELMDLCTNLQKKVIDLEKAKTAQDSEIASLKKKVKKLERRNKSRTPGLIRLRNVGSARRVESSDEAKVTLIDETQGRNDDNLMFDTGVLDKQEVKVEKVVSTAEVTTESATTTTVDELALAQTLIEIKAAKPKDKGKAKMIESEKPLKKKGQIMYDQEVALNLQAQLQAELEEEERLIR